MCQELLRRGYHAINGDHELAYQGDPQPGKPLLSFTHKQHIRDIQKVKTISANDDEEIVFFWGTRNFYTFIDLFDDIFILEIDLDTLNERLERWMV